METGAKHGHTGEAAWTIMTMDGAECMSSGVHILCFFIGHMGWNSHNRTTNEKRKDAFLPLAIGQVVTTISSPLFVWADARCLTGAWCVLAFTYSQDAQSCITMVDIVQA